jgi:hypothetical protein
MSESAQRHERHETHAHTLSRSTRFTGSAWSAWGRTALAIALGIGMAGAVVRAGTTKFWEKRKALSLEMKSEQERLGLAGRAQEKALYAQYPTPEIGLCKPTVAAPGATVPVTVNGKFSEKTTFLVANDQVDLAPGTLAAGRYTAKATIAADASIGFAPIYAIAPVSGAYNSCPALFVGQIASYELKSNNGWTIKLTPLAKAFEVGKQDAKLPYQAAFLKEGETTPFKKMSTDMTFQFNQESGKDIYLSLQPLPADGTPEAELAAIQKKLSDPQAFAKLPPKEMDRVMNRMSELTELQLKTVSAPDYAQKIQKEQEDFGCTSLTLALTGPTPTGRVACGKNVGTRGELKLTGTSTNAP